ncbi:16S rRNA (guanine(966)-N(2))-methyltransferase RsmD [Ruania zhangjianzhongii]|uniref:16S rRNA (guanine(966)-N(2))-methyltransferase RsmD n=1 Tax=Ruania zhangjianzhongii TaxID=2603206 RepID=UPI0011CC8F4D|nr:16S rRNA (guanine(966)-N(2))-methyltransferase RsmD [Ruania zhangjianzhongii]
MTRIVAGTAGGQRLQVPAKGTRPTSERVREALFSHLDHLGYTDGTLVLDLYAGSGALGLEAVSRGAARAVLVESARGAAAACRANAASTQLADRVRIRSVPVQRYLAGPPPAEPFDLVLCDPPYADETTDEVLTALTAQGWLAGDALVVVERDVRSPAPVWPAGWQEQPARRYGETAIHLARTP